MQQVIGKICQQEGIQLHKAVDAKHIVTRTSSDRIGDCCGTPEQGFQRFSNSGDVCFAGAGVEFDCIDLKSLVKEELQAQFPELRDLAFDNDAYQHDWLHRPGLVKRERLTAVITMLTSKQMLSLVTWCSTMYNIPDTLALEQTKANTPGSKNRRQQLQMLLEMSDKVKSKVHDAIPDELWTTASGAPRKRRTPVPPPPPQTWMKY